jgi:leishmanolysin
MNIRLVILITLPILTLQHQCVHEEISKQIDLEGFLAQERESSGIDHLSPNMDINEEERVLQTVTWRPMNIVYDLSRFVSSPENTTIIQNLFAEHLDNRIRGLINVTGPTSIPAFTTTACDGYVTVPSNYHSTPTNADLIVLIFSVSSPSNYLAYASACKLSLSNNRPIVGMVGINMEFLDLSQAGIEQLTYAVFHEIHHIFLFSTTLYNLAPSINRITRTETLTTGAGTTTIYKAISPTVVNYAKSHFNCSLCDGVPFENQGGSGSSGAHWEKIFGGNELMGGIMTGKSVYTLLSAGFMQDSGWYNMDFSKVESTNWGKNKGCGFYDYSCNTAYPEYCPVPDSNVISTQVSCSDDYTTKSYCYQSPFSDTCYINEYANGFVCNSNVDISHTSLNEVNGPGSRCFRTIYYGTASVGCYQASCLNGQLEVNINGVNYSCPSTGYQINTPGLVLNCPDPAKFCGMFNQRCQNDCSGKGRCTANGCWCDMFRGGNDCSVILPCSISPSACSSLGYNYTAPSTLPFSDNTTANTTLNSDTTSSSTTESSNSTSTNTTLPTSNTTNATSTNITEVGSNTTNTTQTTSNATNTTQATSNATDTTQATSNITNTTQPSSNTTNTTQTSSNTTNTTQPSSNITNSTSTNTTQPSTPTSSSTNTTQTTLNGTSTNNTSSNSSLPTTNGTLSNTTSVNTTTNVSNGSYTYTYTYSSSTTSGSKTVINPSTASDWWSYYNSLFGKIMAPIKPLLGRHLTSSLSSLQCVVCLALSWMMLQI